MKRTYMSRIIIFANGDLPNLEKARALLRDDDFIIAADGGTRHALALGRSPNIIIGDMDSFNVERSTLNAKLLRFPADKNETDLELAIAHALKLNPKQVIIVAALGGRLDQTLGNIALLGDLRPSTLRHGERKSNRQCNAFDLRLDDGIEEVFFCRSHCEINGMAGDLVSLIPWQGEAAGVVTENLKWALRDETLYPHKTRGISNEMLGDTAVVQIKSGLLLVVHRRLDH